MLIFKFSNPLPSLFDKRSPLKSYFLVFPTYFMSNSKLTKFSILLNSEIIDAVPSFLISLLLFRFKEI